MKKKNQGEEPALGTWRPMLTESAVFGRFVGLMSLILLIIAVSSKAHAAASWPVEEKQLENGLRILVWPQHRVPVVVSQIWYRIGSSYEQEGKSGISHVLEHMMFKGTEKYPGDAFAQTIAAHGGRDNAFTSRDYTAYYQTIGREHLALCFELEADRMQNLRMLEDEFQKERQVVIEERRSRYEDKPHALLAELLNATAYTQSGYRIPTIGWHEDLDQLTLAEVQAWYKRWYAPNNATLVVVGDVEPDAVFALAQQYFGAIPADNSVVHASRTEQPQRGAKRVDLKIAGQLPYLMMGFKTPVLKTVEAPEEVFALTVLASILDSGVSSRLERHLVREQGLLNSAGVSYDGFERMQNMFILAAIPVEGVSLEQTQQALLDEIKLLQQQAVSAAELQRVKAQVLADSIFEQDDPAYLARQLGMADALGLDWRRVAEFAANIEAVTAAEVQAVAQKYLVSTRMNVARLLGEVAP